MMAITIRDEAAFVWGPKPLIPSANIVGNMRDMKKLVMKIAMVPIQPGKITANATSITFINAKVPINVFAGIVFINWLEEKRPTPNPTRVPVRRYPAVFSGRCT